MGIGSLMEGFHILHPMCTLLTHSLIRNISPLQSSCILFNTVVVDTPVSTYFLSLHFLLLQFICCFNSRQKNLAPPLHFWPSARCKGYFSTPEKHFLKSDAMKHLSNPDIASCAGGSNFVVLQPFTVPWSVGFTTSWFCVNCFTAQREKKGR